MSACTKIIISKGLPFIFKQAYLVIRNGMYLTKLNLFNSFRKLCLSFGNLIIFLQRTCSAFMGKSSFVAIQLGGLGQGLINKYHITVSPEFCCTRQMMLFSGKGELHICNLSDMQQIFACIQQLRSLKWFKTVSSFQHSYSLLLSIFFPLSKGHHHCGWDQQKNLQNKFGSDLSYTKSQVKESESRVQTRWLSSSKGLLCQHGNLSSIHRANTCKSCLLHI